MDQSRYTEVLDLLYTNFHTDEPMSRCLKIFDGTNRIPEADDYTLRALSENLSVMAVDSVTNKLLGVSVNGVVKKDSFPVSRDEVRLLLSPPASVADNISRSQRILRIQGFVTFFR